MFLPKHAFVFYAEEARTEIGKGVREEGKDMGPGSLQYYWIN